MYPIGIRQRQRQMGKTKAKTNGKHKSKDKVTCLEKGNGIEPNEDKHHVSSWKYKDKDKWERQRQSSLFGKRK